MVQSAISSWKQVNWISLEVAMDGAASSDMTQPTSVILKMKLIESTSKLRCW